MCVLPCRHLAAEPWEQPPGCLRVQLRYPACLLEEASIATRLVPQPVHLLGSSSDAVCASLAAGFMAGLLCHRLEAREMAVEEQGQAGGRGSVASRIYDSSSSRGTSAFSGVPSSQTSADTRSSTAAGSVDRDAGRPRAVCLAVTPKGVPGTSGSLSEGLGSSRDGSVDSSNGSSNGSGSLSAGATAMLRTLHCRVPGLQASVALSGSMLDEDWLALCQADILILDWWQPDAAGAVGCAAWDERSVAEVQMQLRESGLLELLWQRFWAGCLLAGLGQGCSLLGLQAGGSSAGSSSGISCSVPPVILPWYHIRPGGRAAGWAALQRALHTSATAEHACAPGLAGVGVMAGGCWQVHPANGRSEMLVAPSRDTLVSSAAWTSAAENSPAALGLQEAEDAEWGFFCELRT